MFTSPVKDAGGTGIDPNVPATAARCPNGDKFSTAPPLLPLRLSEVSAQAEFANEHDTTAEAKT